jgi:hypothetical protein
MRYSARRLVAVSVFALAFWTVGTLVALIARWPYQFDGPGRPEDVARDMFFHGTALSAPIVPIMLPLIGFIFLSRSRRWWGALGTIGICLVAVLTLIGALGEWFAPATPDVPRAILVASGVVGAILAPTLFLAAVADLIDRVRTARQSPRASSQIGRG